MPTMTTRPADDSTSTAHVLGRAAARPVPAHLPARARLLRRQEGLRRRRLRRLHGLARRQAGPFLPGAGLPRRRTRGHHHRGAGDGRRAASDAAGLPRRAGLPVRLLHRRHDHDRRRARRASSARTCRTRSRATSAAAPATARSTTRLHGMARVEEDVAGKACGASLPQPVRRGDRHRPGPLHDGRRDGGAAAPQGAALAARPRPHPRASPRARRWRCRASSRSSPGRTCRAGSTAPRRTRITSSIPTTPTCSTTSCASSASASPRWSPRPRPPPRRPAGCSRSSYEILPAVFDPVAAMAPDAPVLHDKGGAANGNIYVDIHGEVGDVADGFAEADAVHEMTYSTSRVQHVHLETHGSIAWTRRRRPAPRPHQLAGAVHRPAEALPPVRPARRATCTSSPSASAAASAASRRCSPRICACSPR